MDKLMKTSKTVDTILNVVYRILMVAGIIIFVGIGLCLVAELTAELLGMPPFSELTGISISDVELEFKEPIMVSTAFMIVDATTVMFMALIVIATTCYIIKVLRKVLVPMIAGQPFDGTVSGNIKKLGIVVIVGGIILDVAQAVGSGMLLYRYNIPSLLSDNISHIHVNYEINMTNILIGVLVILLSYVFRYGEELQQQADETL